MPVLLGLLELLMLDGPEPLTTGAGDELDPPPQPANPTKAIASNSCRKMIGPGSKDMIEEFISVASLGQTTLWYLSLWLS